MKTSLFLIFIFFFSKINICQNYFYEAKENQSILEIGDSKSNYVSYKTLGFSLGYSRPEFKYQYYVKFNYKYSNFFDSLNIKETQLGLFNEFGINNLSVYFDFGPELRIIKQIYFIPHGGVALRLSLNGVGFLPYSGIMLGIVKNISDKMALEMETGIQILLTDISYFNRYFEIGIRFQLH